MNVKQCTRCGLPENWGITNFDDQGVCNYCRFYDTVKDTLRDFERWEQVFADHLNTHKGKYEYDAVVGFSGGKDSSYIIHRLKTKYNCKVLAVTVNFGFMPSEFALENSKRVAAALETDHIIYDATSEEIQDGFKNAIKRGKLCGLCTGLCTYITRKIAIERHIPFYVLGADRGQLFRDLSPETGPLSGARAVAAMLSPYTKEKTIRQERPGKTKQMRKWLQQFGFSETAARDLYPQSVPLPGTDMLPMNLQFFAFHDYQEKEIKNTLVNEANWIRPEDDQLHSHHDCIFHNAATYYFREANQTTITTGEICVDVREGAISKEEALKTLEIEQLHLDQMDEPYSVFQEHFGIESAYLHKAAKAFGRRMKILTNMRKLQMKLKKPKLTVLDKL